MKMKSLLLALFGFLFFSGCTTPVVDYSVMPPEEIARQMTLQGDEYTDANMYMAPPLTGNPTGNVYYSAKLVAMQLKSTGEVVDAVQIIWNYENDSWLFFQSATLPGPIDLEVSEGARDVERCYSVGICRYSETISAIIPRDELTSSTSDLRLRLGSSGGYVEVLLPRNYVLGYLQGVNRLIAITPPEF